MAWEPHRAWVEGSLSGFRATGLSEGTASFARWQAGDSWILKLAGGSAGGRPRVNATVVIYPDRFDGDPPIGAALPPFRAVPGLDQLPTLRYMTNRRHEADLAQVVEATKGLAHPARLRLIGMLAGGELCVCQMTAVLELAPSTVSQHLSVLAHGELVAERKEGKLVFYRLREDGIAATLLPSILGLLAADPTAKLDRTVVARLRRVAIAKLCAADLDLVAIGVRRSAPLETPSARSRAGL